MKKILLLAAVGLLFAAPLAHAQLGTTTGTTTVSVTVVAEGALTVTTGTTTLTESGSNFSNYTGSTNLNYWIRTTLSGGSGSITLKVTTDFSPANGPSVGSPPSANDKLSYICSITGSGAGTACSSSTTASTTTGTSVVSFGANAHTSASYPTSDTGSTTWTLTNDPKYQTGSYSATVTFTISAS